MNYFYRQQLCDIIGCTLNGIVEFVPREKIELPFGKLEAHFVLYHLYKPEFVELKLGSSIALSQICFPEHPQLFRIQAPSSGSPALSSLRHHICR